MFKKERSGTVPVFDRQENKYLIAKFWVLPPENDNKIIAAVQELEENLLEL
jgi:hypothetical protein